MLHEFGYAVPTEKKQLYNLLKTYGKNAKLLAGGTDLIVDLRAGKLKPELVIDLKKVADFQKITFSEREGLSIGAAVTVMEVVENKLVAQKYPLLVRAGNLLGSPQLRNRATVAGNLCTASPCADMGTSLLALGAHLEIASANGSRMIELKAFFTGVKRVAMKEYELVQRIIVPPESANAASGMEKIKRIKGHDMALASVALVKKGDLMRIAVGSCGETPLVLKDLNSKTSVKEACAEALRTIKPITDIRASQEFRTFMVQVLVRKLMESVK